MKRIWAGIVFVSLASSLLPPVTAGQPQEVSKVVVPAELLAKPFLYDVVRHLYRWYLDEGDLERVVGHDDLVFWVRGLQPKLDEEDHSRFGEIIFPQLAISVKLKKADYRIPELDVAVDNESFMITSVSHIPFPDRRPESCEEVKVTYSELRDDLFRTRRQARFPKGDLLMHLRLAVRKELAKEAKDRERGSAVGAQVVHMAPLSPVANDVWVFWESGPALIRFTSDIDLVNPAVWEHQDLAVSFYDVDQQVVVSLDEAAGSNAYLTRDQVGRALYNCIVLGRRLELDPKDVQGSGEQTNETSQTTRD